MQIAICEDKAEDRERLLQLLGKWKAHRQLQVQVRCFESGEGLLRAWEPGLFQIIFMDIYMDGYSGIKTAKKIREHDADCAIILATVSTEHGLDGFAVGALHYLLKPVQYAAMDEALSRCRAMLDVYAKCIEVHENRVPVRVLHRDIRYVEVRGNSCLIHTTSRTIKVYATLDSLMKHLEGPPFLRCHRSYVVNMRQVKCMQDSGFALDACGSVVPVGRAYRTAARLGYGAYLAAVTENRLA